MPVHSLFLKYFHESSKTGSLRLAAKNLKVSPSALSRKISETEKELKTLLFTRSISGVSLTPAGKLMQVHVDETLQSYQQLASNFNSLKGEYSGQITIAGPASVIPTFLPSVMSKFHLAHSQVITAFKGTSDIDVDHLLHDSNVDIVLGFDLPGLTTAIEINRCPLRVGAIVSPGHPLTEYKEVSFSECLKYSLVLPDPIWPLRKQLDSVIRLADGSPDIVAASDSVEFMREMIREETCISFATMIGFESELSKKTLEFVPIGEPEALYQELIIVCREGLGDTQPGRDLIDLLAKQVENYRNL
jgi:DNA-binding transcriptional LysR family regulator